MHIRKLVKAGQISHTISLPKEWIEKHSLGKGDLIYIKETDHDLVLSSSEKPVIKNEFKEITLAIDNKSLGTVKREITSAYINNYNTISIIGKSLPKYTKDIRGFLHDFVALEISEQTATKIVAKDLLNLSEISIPQTIKRMDMILRSIVQDTKTFLDGTDLYESIHYRDYDVNRLYFLLYRLLKSGLRDTAVAQEFGLSNERILSLWYLIINIENIADTNKTLCKLFPKVDKNQKDVILELYSRVEKEYLEVMRAHYKGDKTLAELVASNRISVFDSFREFYKGNATPLFAEIVENLKEFESQVCNIARIVLDEE